MRFAAHSRGRCEAGQTLPIVVGFMVCLLLMCGAVIDLGNAYRVRQALRASTDAAATAAADNLPDPTAAAAAAHAYGSESSGKNRIPGTSNATLTVTSDCAVNANFCNPVNTVHVQQSVDTPTYFLGMIGIGSIKATAKSDACSPCGGLPLDVVIVLDRTGSMSGSKLQNAKDGVTSFMQSMDPAVNNVGLVILPPIASGSNACATGSTSDYDDPNAKYVAVPLGNSYATSLGQLNNASPLMSTLNCVKAGGGTAYANALDAAQAELNARGRVGTQKVIIILSDGAANTGPSYLATTSPYRTNPCGKAVSIATASKAAKVIMYSIAYDTGGAGNDYCYAAQGAKVGNKTAGNSDTPEVPNIRANSALQQIASPNNYYAQPNPSDLTGIFNAISADIAKGSSRIIG